MPQDAAEITLLYPCYHEFHSPQGKQTIDISQIMVLELGNQNKALRVTLRNEAQLTYVDKDDKDNTSTTIYHQMVKALEEYQESLFLRCMPDFPSQEELNPEGDDQD